MKVTPFSPRQISDHIGPEAHKIAGANIKQMLYFVWRREFIVLVEGVLCPTYAFVR